MSRRERILARLKEMGAEGPKRSLGQNFLISDHVIEKIVAAARSEEFTDLVEVGPGLGALTEDLLQLGHPLTLIELDRVFAESWRKRAAERSDLRVIEADALQIDWRELGLREGSLLVSNLPYQISSSLVIERCLEPAGLKRMVLMFQKEVAQRINARSGTKEYGLLTVMAQAFWETATVCDAGPRDFYPAPNVASRVLHFRRRRTEWVERGEGTATGLLNFVKAAFSHRRKILLRNLQSEYFGGSAEVAPKIEKILADAGFDATVRAEALDPSAFVRVYLAVEKEFAGHG